ncbi:MAG TPA: hypothetical protein DDY13_13620 [Cytophagales bacterium]|nr:hypothetical protein [Cytophagales bacterium]
MLQLNTWQDQNTTSKTINMILLVLLFFQCVDIENIQEKVKEIDLKVDILKVESFEDADLYSDSDNKSFEAFGIKNIAIVNLKRFYKDNELVKMSIYFDGEYANLKSHYYLCNGELIYLRRELKSFSLPKWHDEFDAKDYTIKEVIFFVSNKEVISLNQAGIKRDITETQKKNIFRDFESYKSYRE